MHARSSSWIIALVLFSIMGTGCRKDKEGTAPTVEILFPGNAFTVHVPDTFVVRVRATDDEALEDLSIMLVDDAGSPIASTVTAVLNGTSSTVERDVVVSDERIPSGNYTLVVRVTDGNAETRAFRSINIQAAPLRLRALYITPPFSSGNVAITQVDSTGSLSTWMSFGDLNAAAVNGTGQQVVLAGGPNAPLSAFPAPATNPAWVVPNENTLSIPYFNSVYVDATDGRTYASCNNGRIRGISVDGLQQFTAQAMADQRPYAMVVVGDVLVCEQRSIALPASRLVTYTRANGSLLTFWPLDLDVVAMYGIDDDQVLVFGNRNGDGVIQDRNIEFGGNFEMRVFPGMPLEAVVQLNDNGFALALPNGLHRFDRTTNGAVQFASITASALAYDRVNGTLLAGSGDQLITLDPTNGSMGGTTTMPTPIGSILPLFNR